MIYNLLIPFLSLIFSISNNKEFVKKGDSLYIYFKADSLAGMTKRDWSRTVWVDKKKGIDKQIIEDAYSYSYITKVRLPPCIYDLLQKIRIILV
jgi:hypothetical protein